MGDLYNVVEFYRSGEKRPFLRRIRNMNIPSVGNLIDVSGVTGVISAVVWNLDYCGKPDEQWRCNVYISKFSDGEKGSTQ